MQNRPFETVFIIIPDRHKNASPEKMKGEATE